MKKSGFQKESKVRINLYRQRQITSYYKSNQEIPFSKSQYSTRTLKNCRDFR